MTNQTTDRPKRMLNAKQVAEKLSWGISTVWQKSREGKMPQPYKYKDVKGSYWIEYELDDWLNETLRQG